MAELIDGKAISAQLKEEIKEETAKLLADGKTVTFETNNAGGILGGMSNGNEIFFRVAVKPVPSIFKTQKTVNVDSDGLFHNTDLTIKGRHDVCLCPRIVPVIEAMTAITLCDMVLQNLSAQ